MSAEDSGIPSDLRANDLRRLADAQERTATALEALLDLKRREITGEIMPHWVKPKSKDKWIACRKEIPRLLEEVPYLDWLRAKSNPIFRDPNFGNMYREHQWRRFLNQHAIPAKPDDGSGVVLVALGKADNEGPAVCARQDSLHCAEKAFRAAEDDGRPWTWDSFSADSGCAFCSSRKGRLAAAEARAARDRRLAEEIMASRAKGVLPREPVG